jgi:hypothetical protein
VANEGLAKIFGNVLGISFREALPVCGYFLKKADVVILGPAGFAGRVAVEGLGVAAVLAGGDEGVPPGVGGWRGLDGEIELVLDDIHEAVVVDLGGAFEGVLFLLGDGFDDLGSVAAGLFRSAKDAHSVGVLALAALERQPLDKRGGLGEQAIFQLRTKHKKIKMQIRQTLKHFQLPSYP